MAVKTRKKKEDKKEERRQERRNKLREKKLGIWMVINRFVN